MKKWMGILLGLLLTSFAGAQAEQTMTADEGWALYAQDNYVQAYQLWSEAAAAGDAYAQSMLESLK